MCNRAAFTVSPNKGLKRSLYDLKVWCSHKKEGCQWTGELRELEKHLNEKPKLYEQLVGCDFSRVECCHCSKEYQRRYINTHQTEDCNHRPLKCQFCGKYEATYEDVATNHWPVCRFFPESCPKKCGEKPQRQYLEHHVSQVCPLTVVNCDFHYAGCEVQLPRKDLPAHLAENMGVHVSLVAVQDRKREEEITELKVELEESRNREIRLGKDLEENARQTNAYTSLMARQNQMKLTEQDEKITKLKDELMGKFGVMERKIEALEEETAALRRSFANSTREFENQLEPVLPSLPVEFTMSDFEDHKQKKEVWYSPPFYTHPRGYKMCLRVNPVGPNCACILVGARLMRGEFDHLLQWPFEHSIAFEILNQLQDSGHYRLTAAFVGTQKACRVTGGERAEKGTGGCVPYAKLGHDLANHCHYLQNDCLRIRVSHVVKQDVLHFQRQSIDSRSCHCPIELTMTDFARFKQEHGRWFSPSFYTHARGYIICIEVTACDSPLDTHLGVYVHLMQGKYDFSVAWPFRGVITIHLLNQQRDKGHYVKTIPFANAPDEQAEKVTPWVMNSGRGLSEFISFDQLDLDLDRDSQYLLEDCLRFRVFAKVKLVKK